MKQTYEGQTYSGTWTASKTASASVIENFLFNRNNKILSGLREMTGENQEPKPAPGRTVSKRRGPAKFLPRLLMIISVWKDFAGRKP